MAMPPAPATEPSGSHPSSRVGAVLALLSACTLTLGAEPNAPPRSLRVAICQIRCVDGDRAGNLARIEAAVQTASQGGAALACFPETALLGWVNPEAQRRAEAIPGPGTRRLAALARRHGLMLAVGLAEKAGERLYDTAVLIDRDGTLLLKHRKVNILAHLMDPPYTPGSVPRANVTATGYGRIGLLICADTFRPDLLQATAAQQPDVLLVPYGWAAEPHEWPEHGRSLTACVTTAARTVGCAVVGTDLVGTITHGPWTGRTYGGQSVISDRRGELLARLADREVEVRVVRVPLGRDGGTASKGPGGHRTAGQASQSANRARTVSAARRAWGRKSGEAK